MCTTTHADATKHTNDGVLVVAWTTKVHGCGDDIGQVSLAAEGAELTSVACNQ